MVEYYSIRQACQYLHVAQSTLRRWENEGKIKPFRTSGNQRRYTQEMLDAVLQGTTTTSDNQKLIIGYCRVSSYAQKAELKKQQAFVTSYCEMQGVPFKLITDIGSGLNYERTGFKELIHYICQHKCVMVVVGYQDRLVRFGFGLLKDVCAENQVKLIAINQTTAVGSKLELKQDMKSIINDMAGDLYNDSSEKQEKVKRGIDSLFA